jgi:polysaccharide deacetylase 2 family uncharacterized protein YibQ
LPKSPEPPKVSDAAPGETQTPQVAAVAPREGGNAAPDDAPQAGQSAPQLVATDPDTLAALEDGAVTTADAPVTGEAAGLVSPVDVAQTDAVAPSQETPIFPNPQALAPMMPQDADEVSINTEPAALPQPKVIEPQENVEPDMAGDVASGEVAEGDKPMISEEIVAEAEDAPAQTQPLVKETPVADPASEPEQQAALAPVEPPAEDAPEAIEQDTPDASAEAVGDEDAPKIAILAPAVRPQIGTPAISLTDRNNGVTVNRLANGSNGAEVLPVTIITEDGGAAAGGDPRPIVRYGQKFINPENKPLMSIVLIDDGSDPTSGSPGIAALRSFPYTLSFAVDSSLPDATERMALYREEGFEVLAMVDLPEGAQASDVETNLGVTLAQMGEVVGLLEGTGTGLQGSRSVSDQVTAILQQSGHGLVSQNKGLNTMPKLARKEGVPAYPVFRDFDSKGQSATVIRRFLDQAAFKAGQEGAVIMLGRLRADTITALLLWGLQDRAGQVALAPISAVLMREED